MARYHYSIIQDCKIAGSKLAFSRHLRYTMTPAERVVWEILRNKRLHGIKFRRQQIIEGFIVDFFCSSCGVVIEIDGGIHTTEEQKQVDRHRTEVFEAKGLRVLRFKNEQVFEDIEWVKKRILEFC